VTIGPRLTGSDRPPNSPVLTAVDPDRVVREVMTILIKIDRISTATIDDG
jgi:hypothetical protein